MMTEEVYEMVGRGKRERNRVYDHACTNFPSAFSFSSRGACRVRYGMRYGIRKKMAKEKSGGTG